MITRDPLDGQNGTTTVANPYHYTSNDPINRTDPTGMRNTDAGMTGQPTGSRRIGGGGCSGDTLCSYYGGFPCWWCDDGPAPPPLPPGTDKELCYKDGQWRNIPPQDRAGLTCRRASQIYQEAGTDTSKGDLDLVSCLVQGFHCDYFVATNSEAQKGAFALAAGLVTESAILDGVCADKARASKLDAELSRASQFLRGHATCRDFLGTIQGSLATELRGAALFTTACVTVSLTVHRPWVLVSNGWLPWGGSGQEPPFVDATWSVTGGWRCRAYESRGAQIPHEAGLS